MKNFRSIIAGIVVCLLTLLGCSKSDDKVDVENIIKSYDEDNKGEKNQEDFTLKVLAVSIDEKYIKQVFKELYPKANIEVIKYNSYEANKIKEAIESANDPDIVMYYSEKVGIFNSTDAFEDLSQPQYNSDEIKAKMTERQISQCMSHDDKKLIALSMTSGTMATYYRTDILQQYGITSDSEQLAKLMETSEGWLSIANTLKKDDIKILDWSDAFVKMVLNEYGLYDKDMNLIIDNKELKDALKLAKPIYENDLTSDKDVWGEVGKKAIKEGKIAMAFMNRWGEDRIKSYVPELTGKWRVTRLPLNLNCESGTINISILAKSEHKMEAWNLIKTFVERDINYFQSLSSKPSEFLGGQLYNKFFNDLAAQLPKVYPNLLDEKAYDIVTKQLSTYAHTTDNVDELLNSIKVKIDEETSKEREILIDHMKENR